MSCAWFLSDSTRIIPDSNAIAEYLKNIDDEQIPNSDEFLSPSLFSATVQDILDSEDVLFKLRRGQTNDKEEYSQNEGESVYEPLTTNPIPRKQAEMSQHGRFGKFCSRVKANILYRFHKGEARIEESEMESISPESQLIDYTFPVTYGKLHRKNKHSAERTLPRRATEIFIRRASFRSDNPLFGNINQISTFPSQVNSRYSISRVPARQLSQLSIGSIVIPGTDEIHIRRDSLLRVERSLTRASLLRMDREQRNSPTVFEEETTTSSLLLSSSSLDHQSLHTVDEHLIEEEEVVEMREYREMPVRIEGGETSAIPTEIEPEIADTALVGSRAQEREHVTTSDETSKGSSDSISSGSYCSILQSPPYMLKSGY